MPDWLVCIYAILIMVGQPHLGLYSCCGVRYIITYYRRTHSVHIYYYMYVPLFDFHLLALCQSTLSSLVFFSCGLAWLASSIQCAIHQPLM